METPPTGKGRTGLVQCLVGWGLLSWERAVEVPSAANLQGPPPLPAVTCKVCFVEGTIPAQSPYPVCKASHVLQEDVCEDQ